MSFNEQDLKKIEQLAYLDSESDEHSQLAEEVHAIMDFVEQLRKVDTSKTTPLFHPSELQQRFRADEVTEENCQAQLAALAPLFENELYQVPKVIDSDSGQ
ncbi:MULTISPECIES: Asp-tRNA(Asn)/Glu-tRNA(Gln) amidotransferase subunit GatC [Legionella]|uniref:Aspartyl/glutamyl-tRNA(Asn/Gln) amidotransferase subunit C n=1 Tax=Legionella drozanskii LLAP-1 TaxID=1212489 RepID=A0A0W0TBU5_9GAMM|nr:MULTISPECIES: Asp-tRNA(Asn)/Glu-tRNA(Gln) amidotransferase subunit GatC [Legionella]KTC93087.1 glutamyl/tRNA (Gln) amidotransferase subunit C [Legionella drozanskii LLAP-1]PJE11989.1 MAG: Asp-tRNA(Asn)/Glu-tRNA(Gln) amidotransferase subunit GatC [Legionella sp.]